MGLFDPIEVGRFHAKNRFTRAAAKEQLCSDEGHIPEQVYELYEKLAKGGLGMIITGSMRVKFFPGTVPQGLYRLDVGTYQGEYKRLADIGKKYNCTMIAQATYSHKDINALTHKDFDDIARHYAEAAWFAETCGFDGIEIHEAHNMFFDQVLMGKFNRRTDEYGKNKHLLVTRCIKEIRKYVSPDFILISKIDSENTFYTQEESLEHCKVLEAAGIDAIEISGSPLGGPDDLSYFKDFAIRLKKEVSVPVILTGGNRSFELIEELHEKHGVDMFGLCRPTSREFDLVNRWESGDTTESKCISCGLCNNSYGAFCPFNKDIPKGPSVYKIKDLKDRLKELKLKQ